MVNKYQPRPIHTDHIELDAELSALVEILAEHAHDIWAAQRISDGWVFGPERSDELHCHPCLVPYAALPETEKVYDRNVAIGTIRAVLALGFAIVKRGTD